jgi:hypothetical protein
LGTLVGRLAETLAISQRHDWARLTNHAALAEMWLLGSQSIVAPTQVGMTI